MLFLCCFSIRKFENNSAWLVAGLVLTIKLKCCGILRFEIKTLKDLKQTGLVEVEDLQTNNSGLTYK